MIDHKLDNYDAVKALADNPVQMASRIIEITRQLKEHRIGNDPNRRLAFIERLRTAVELSRDDENEGHQSADDVLLEYINDPEISMVYGTVRRYFND